MNAINVWLKLVILTEHSSRGQFFFIIFQWFFVSSAMLSWQPHKTFRFCEVNSPANDPCDMTTNHKAPIIPLSRTWSEAGHCLFRMSRVTAVYVIDRMERFQRKLTHNECARSRATLMVISMEHVATRCDDLFFRELVQKYDVLGFSRVSRASTATASGDLCCWS